MKIGIKSPDAKTNARWNEHKENRITYFLVERRKMERTKGEINKLF
jgi:hypothetical protein